MGGKMQSSRTRTRSAQHCAFLLGPASFASLAAAAGTQAQPVDQKQPIAEIQVAQVQVAQAQGQQRAQRQMAQAGALEFPPEQILITGTSLSHLRLGNLLSLRLRD